MSTQEDRIAAFEQTMVPRIDLINAVNRVTLQQAQTASDLSHERTILLGVTGSQGQDIKIIKGDVSTLKEDVSDIKDRLGRLETKSDEHTALLTQILARLPEKP